MLRKQEAEQRCDSRSVDASNAAYPCVQVRSVSQVLCAIAFFFLLQCE